MTTKLKENCNNLKCAIYKIKETLSGIVHFLVLKDYEASLSSKKVYSRIKLWEYDRKGCFHNIRGVCGDKWHELHHAASSYLFPMCCVSTYKEGRACGLMLPILQIACLRCVYMHIRKLIC